MCRHLNKQNTNLLERNSLCFNLHFVSIFHSFSSLLLLATFLSPLLFPFFCLLPSLSPQWKLYRETLGTWKIINRAGQCQRLLVTYSSYPLSCSFLPNKSQISESVVCCLGPVVFHLHLRKLEHLTVCRCQKKQHFLLSYLNTNTMGYWHSFWGFQWQCETNKRN